MHDQKIMRLPEVRARTGRGRTTIYMLVRRVAFPAPVELPGKRIGWHAHEIEEWIAQRPRRPADRAVACANSVERSLARISPPIETTPTPTNTKPVRRPSKPKCPAPSETERDVPPDQQQLLFE